MYTLFLDTHTHIYIACVREKDGTDRHQTVNVRKNDLEGGCGWLLLSNLHSYKLFGCLHNMNALFL